MDQIKTEYEVLCRMLKLYLPIKAFPTKELVSTISNQHPGVNIDSEFFITDVINTGDLSGILCMIESKDVVGLVCSLTHIEIAPMEALKIEIEEYQAKRARRVDTQYKVTSN